MVRFAILALGILKIAFTRCFAIGKGPPSGFAGGLSYEAGCSSVQPRQVLGNFTLFYQTSSYFPFQVWKPKERQEERCCLWREIQKMPLFLTGCMKKQHSLNR